MWKEPSKERIALWALVCFNNKRRNDVQNRSKALCDLFEKAGVYVDDSQIDDIRMMRGVAVDDRDEVLGGSGYVSVRLWEIK
jgi:Holliday junction resolvase RusA-like endonuclease